ncbi:tyrosine-protein phosphatase [Novosphingobium sp.]|uniref:tyrosine-protein phosphatase n=1 Tax=Novosphingobium sp. TaxID=1874826 RepID=UPI0035B2FF95
MPPIGPALAESNPVAALFAKYQQAGNRQPSPLMTADGKAYLSFALEEIDRRWGSIEAYLQAELGVGRKEIKRLRALYTQ